MVIPEPARMIATVRERRGLLTNPTHLAMVDVVLQHMEGELIEFDLDKVMDTLIAEPIYHSWGGRFARDDVFIIQGRETVRNMYEGLMATGFPPTEIRIERFSVGDDSVFFDGDMEMIWEGKLLQSMGQEVDDPDARYLETLRTAQVMPFVGGLMRGEDLYFGPSRLTKIND